MPARTDLHIDADEWRARLREEGDGFADPVLMKPLAELQVPVVIRGDGLRTVVWELETLLACFRHQAPDAAGAIPHPCLQGRRFTLDDIEAVTGPDVDAWNAFTVGADIAEFRRGEYAFQTEAAEFLRPAPPAGARLRRTPWVPTGRWVPSRALAAAAGRRLGPR